MFPDMTNCLSCSSSVTLDGAARRLASALAAGVLLGCQLLGAQEPPTAESLLSDSIEHHDPEAVWGRLPLALELSESRPDGADRTTRLRFDPAAGAFELERHDAGRVTAGRIAAGECSWELVSGEMSEEELEGLTCDRLRRLRDYYGYLWGLPMKLRDPGTRLGPVQKVLVDGKERWRLRVTYEPEVGSDVWDFDFDPASHALVAYRFFHDEAAGDGEWIALAGELAGAGLRLPQDRSWYTNSGDEFLGRDRLVEIE
jgi:hypothetical protein